MQRPISEPRMPARVSLALARWLRWCIVGAALVFAVIGVATTAMYVLVGLPEWTISGYAAFAHRAFESAVQLAWEYGSKAFQALSFFLLAAALFIAIVRVKLVAQVIADFITARGPIYSLQSTIIEVSETVDKLSDIRPTIELLSEKIDAAQKQLTELQRYTSSERGGGNDETNPDPPRNGVQPAAPSNNWEELRKLWYANTARLEAVIDKIEDGRKKLKYDRMPRTNYHRIITALADDRLISNAAKEASIKLNTNFMSYKRSQLIPDNVIGSLRVFDALLDQELGKAPQDEIETAGA
jgi:hypothetical protein